MPILKNYFVFGNVSSLIHAITVESKETLGSAEPDIEEYTIPGRDGKFPVFNGRYHNVSIPYECYMAAPKEEDLARYAGDLKRWLLSRPGEYRRLEDTYDRDHFRLALYSGGIDLDEVVRGHTRQTIVFDCKPFRYRKAGERSFSFEAGEGRVLNNDTGFDANPKLEIQLLKGNLDDRVTITVDTEGSGGAVFSISSIPDNQELLGLDGETRGVWSDGNYTNLVKAFPVLPPGKSTITVSGERVAGVTLTPQWREL